MSLAPVIAFVGPSGVGKDSVMQALVARQPGFRVVRRTITRGAGGGEEFDAVTEVEFRRRQDEGRFALQWQAHGLHYGIPAEVAALRRGAAGVLVNLSRRVLEPAQALFGDMITVSLTAAPEVLSQRLAARGRETGPDQLRRLARQAPPLPAVLSRVIELDNSGALEDTVDRLLARLQPESA